MSNRDRRRADDRPLSPEQGQFRADVNSAAQLAVGQSAATPSDKAGPDTAAAAQRAVSNRAVFLKGVHQGAGSQEAAYKERLLGHVSRIEGRIIELAGRWFEPVARIVIFIIYFWFGFLKLVTFSPATPLAAALTTRTIGMQYFNISFKMLAVYECGLGILFLIRAMTRISVVLLVIHMGIVSAPLIIVANVAWTHPFVPTLEGQYIIKDLAIIALAVGIMAQRRSPGDQRETKVRHKSPSIAGDSPQSSYPSTATSSNSPLAG